MQYLPQFCFSGYFTRKQDKSFNLISACVLLCFQMSSLLYLSPEQLVGLMFDDVPGLPEKSVVISAVFDHLTASPQRERIVSTLPIMVESSKMVREFFSALFHLFLIAVPPLTPGRVSLWQRNVSCASYQIMWVSSCTECVSCAEPHGLVLTRLSVRLFASFHRLDHLMVSVLVDLESVIVRTKSALLQNVPQGETRALSLSGDVCFKSHVHLN